MALSRRGFLGSLAAAALSVVAKTYGTPAIPTGRIADTPAVVRTTFTWEMGLRVKDFKYFVRQSNAGSLR